MGIDNVDRRLLARFEASREHERVRRELLPPVWISADVDDTGPLGELSRTCSGAPVRTWPSVDALALAERAG